MHKLVFCGILIQLPVNVVVNSRFSMMHIFYFCIWCSADDVLSVRVNVKVVGCPVFPSALCLPLILTRTEVTKYYNINEVL